MCLERRTSHVGGKQAAVRTEGQNSACVLFVFGVNFPWLPGLSAFCLWRLVSWCVGRLGGPGVCSLRLILLVGLVVWPCLPGLRSPGSFSTLFLSTTNHVRAGSPWWFVLQKGRRPKDRSLDRYLPYGRVVGYWFIWPYFALLSLVFPTSFVFPHAGAAVICLRVGFCAELHNG